MTLTSLCPRCATPHDIGGVDLPRDVRCPCGVTLAACSVIVPSQTPYGAPRVVRYWCAIVVPATTPGE